MPLPLIIYLLFPLFLLSFFFFFRFLLPHPPSFLLLFSSPSPFIHFFLSPLSLSHSPHNYSPLQLSFTSPSAVTSLASFPLFHLSVHFISIVPLPSPPFILPLPFPFTLSNYDYSFLDLPFFSSLFFPFPSHFCFLLHSLLSSYPLLP